MNISSMFGYVVDKYPKYIHKSCFQEILLSWSSAQFCKAKVSPQKISCCLLHNYPIDLPHPKTNIFAPEMGRNPKGK